MRLLKQPAKMCDRLPGEHAYHLVVRGPPEERRLSDGEQATEAMAGVGIAPAGDDAGSRVVAVRHAEDHIHVVATLAREVGRAPRTFNDHRTLNTVMH